MKKELDEFVGAFCLNLMDKGCVIEMAYQGRYTIVFRIRKGNRVVSWAVDTRQIKDAVIEPSANGLLQSKDIISFFGRAIHG